MPSNDPAMPIETVDTQPVTVSNIPPASTTEVSVTLTQSITQVLILDVGVQGPPGTAELSWQTNEW